MMTEKKVKITWILGEECGSRLPAWVKYRDIDAIIQFLEEVRDATDDRRAR
jgi:hypothetical protein